MWNVWPALVFTYYDILAVVTSEPARAVHTVIKRASCYTWLAADNIARLPSSPQSAKCDRQTVGVERHIALSRDFTQRQWEPPTTFTARRQNDVSYVGHFTITVSACMTVIMWLGRVAFCVANSLHSRQHLQCCVFMSFVILFIRETNIRYTTFALHSLI